MKGQTDRKQARKERRVQQTKTAVPVAVVPSRGEGDLCVLGQEIVYMPEPRQRPQVNYIDICRWLVRIPLNLLTQHQMCKHPR